MGAGGGEGMFLDKGAGEVGETLGIAVTVKDWSEHSPQIAIGVRGSAARPELHADLHHAAQMQAAQMEVGEVGGGSKDRENLHTRLQFRICLQRHIDQALDLATVAV